MMYTIKSRQRDQSIITTAFESTRRSSNMKFAGISSCSLLLLVLFLTYVPTLDGAKILGIFHMAAHSHYQCGENLLKALAKRGHEVTMVSPYNNKNPIKNFKDVVLTGEVERLEAFKKDMFAMGDPGILWGLVWGPIMGQMFTENTLKHKAVEDLLKSDEQFDLVLIENFMNRAFKGFCYHFKTPCIMVSTLGASRWTNGQMGNPGNPAYLPDLLLGKYTTNMNFWQRTVNALTYTISEIVDTTYGTYTQNQLLQKYFPGAPHLDELDYNTSFMLLNSHVSFGDPAPLVPNMVNVGGYHVKPTKKLPQHLQEYLDGAPEGVIYFSMGSNLKSTLMPVEKRDAILKAFSKLKYKVLWKWEDDTLPGQPPNVKLMKWVPQNDLLAHPNIKLFITHGGLLSTIESIYHGIPVIGIPVFGDQNFNMIKAEHAGYGVMVPYFTLTEEDLSAALDKVLNNPSYAEEAKKRSKILHDEPIKPLDRAVFWTEYVLRHNGAPHLRTAALDLAWYQYLLLDVVAFVAAVALIGMFVTCKVLKMIFCRGSCKNKQKVDQKKKKN